MSRDIVYLDSKIWIELLKVRLGERTDETGEKTYQELKSKVKEEEIICPMSLVSVGEVQRYHDKDTKEEIFEMMIELSDNHSITLYNVVNRAEIRNYVWMKLHGEHIYDMKEKSVKKGIGYMGGNYSFTGIDREISEEEQEKLHEVIKTEWATRKVFMSDGFLEGPKLQAKNRVEYWEDKLEEIRQENKDLGESEEEARKILIENSFYEEVMPKIRETCLTLNVDPVKLFYEDRDYSFDMFYSQFPAFYTRMNLTIRRDFDWNRPIEGNDLWDIMSLSVAIPYCDVVASEEYFVGKTYASDLPEIYGTEVVQDLEGLREAISS